MCVAIRSTDSRQGSASEKHGVGDVSVPSALNGAGVGSGLNRIDPRLSQAVVRPETVRPKRRLGRLDFGDIARSPRVAMLQQRIRASQGGATCASTGPFSHTPSQHTVGREAGSPERCRNAAAFDLRHAPRDQEITIAHLCSQSACNRDRSRRITYEIGRCSRLRRTHCMFNSVLSAPKGLFISSARHISLVVLPLSAGQHHE